MVPFVMVVVLERSERLREVLDVVALLALAARHLDLNDVMALVQAEQVADGHVTITSRRDNLQGEFQGMWLMERRRLRALALTHHPLSFETAANLILRNPWLFLACFKTYEA
jgi:hypothetical protein